ncbi:MAG: glutaminase A [Desulfosarcinaceae bacterium]|nr:glutaminase A [Desulfosarcinaceae bacterium]
MQALLDKAVADARPYAEKGRLATYIPELTKANRRALGVCVVDLDGNHWRAGDFDTTFTIQSVSKVATLLYALETCGIQQVLSRIGAEQTADAFNSIIKLETRNSGKPLNPFINAGAIALIAMLMEAVGEDLLSALLDYLKTLTGNRTLSVDADVLRSERATGDINRALAYYQKGMHTFTADVTAVLDVYFHMCSLEVQVIDLARMAALIASNGRHPATGEHHFSAESARCAKVLMTTCGLYDSSGWFALEVGIPSKSGVGGGILSVVPGQFGIGVVGPSLDDKGNSIAGVELLRRLSRTQGWSLFA